MVMLVIEPTVEEQVIAERQARGIDQHDEVWDGVYVVSPLANNEHQDLATGLAAVFKFVVSFSDLGRVFGGVNVSDQDHDWMKNYRVPDVAVFLKGNPAQDRQSHWFGGPDFAVEIVSPGDRSREKLDFYAAVNVRELLIVDRDPWALELFRLQRGSLLPVGRATVGALTALASQVLPFRFQLAPGESRPLIEVMHDDGRPSWLV